MKIDTCILLSLKYSVSSTSSITTTYPSQGETNSPSALLFVLWGNLKNCKNKMKTIKQALAVSIQIKLELNNKADAPVKIVDTSNVTPKILYPSLCMVIIV